MSTKDSYVMHPLNKSKTKQSYLFPKENRFSKNTNRAVTEAFYDLPSTTTKRTTSFGFGNKMTLAEAHKSPPPGSYQLPSDFEKKSHKNSISIGEGREKVTFGSFLLEAIKRNKDIPSPDRYNLSAKRAGVGGGMGPKIITDFQLKYKRSIPGPGTYKLTGNDLCSQGHYLLSHFRNASSPRYYSDIKPRELVKSRNCSTLSYDIQQKEIGKYSNSKYKNTVNGSFSKSKRPGMENTNMLQTPGYKYRSFSEFGSVL